MSQRNIMLIATGSATSWMKDKIVANKGGLHARVTCNLHLSPFTLNETERYLATRGIEWDRYQPYPDIHESLAVFRFITAFLTPR